MWDDPDEVPPSRPPRREPDPYGPPPGGGQPPFDPNATRRANYRQDQPGQGGYGQQGQGGYEQGSPEQQGYGQPDYGQRPPNYGQPPAYRPDPPRYPAGPAGQPPRWPAQEQQGYGGYAGSATPGAYAPQPSYPPPAQPVPRQRPVERAPEGRSTGHGVSLPHLPIAHVFLIGGVAAMAFSIAQPWGKNAAGVQLFIKDFAAVQLNHGTGVNTANYAVQAATGIVIAAAVLSAVLLLLNTVVTIINKVIGVVGLGGCATLIFFPVLWGAATLLFVVLLAAAGFAGLGSLSNLPIVANHGISTASVQSHALGFYLWIGGAIAVFVGMLGQLVLRRR